MQFMSTKAKRRIEDEGKQTVFKRRCEDSGSFQTVPAEKILAWQQRFGSGNDKGESTIGMFRMVWQPMGHAECGSSYTR